jgi:hypothetical protein
VSTPHISSGLRKIVRARANESCEYCLVTGVHQVHSFPIDHIISVKHGGVTDEQNLALSCLDCNLNEGSDIASLSARTGELIRFFNPRADQWEQHFRIGADGFRIVPLTDVGEATCRILQFNAPKRIEERYQLHLLSLYPPFP